MVSYIIRHVKLTLEIFFKWCRASFLFHLRCCANVPVWIFVCCAAVYL